MPIWLVSSVSGRSFVANPWIGPLRGLAADRPTGLPRKALCPPPPCVLIWPNSGPPTDVRLMAVVSTDEHIEGRQAQARAYHIERIATAEAARPAPP
jgi:hypothetical protein